MPVPYWVEDAVFYQIFPDRFANGDVRNDPSNVKSWGTAPTVDDFMGGDLRGIIQKMDYLLDLGITAIYLTPIFQATSTHRYNTTDYFKIDSRLGEMKDFHALLDSCHANHIRVILDGVFNHCGRGFFAFNDLLENQEHSSYKDWYYVSRFPVDAYSRGEAKDYLGWWGYKSLPKFNTGNLKVREYLLNVARFWLQQGIDGWRLDVPNEIDDDAFWAEFRSVVKSVNPDAYLVGEIWESMPRWVGEDHFDGLMNYPFREATLGFLTGKYTSNQYAERLDRLTTLYPRENVYSMYVPLGSHDTERIFTVLGNDLKKLKLAFLLQFSFPGAPAIYYGDETGIEGNKDPDNRKAFIWDTQIWNHEIRNWVKKMISLRKQYVALRRGNFTRILADDGRTSIAFIRALGDQSILVVVNNSSTRRQISLKITGQGWQDGHILHNLLGNEEYIISGDTLHTSVPPFTGMWLA